MARNDGKATDESAVRAVVDRLVQAICRKDVDAAMLVFAPDVVSYDLGPPLWHGGGEEFRRHWRTLFDAYEGPIVYEMRDMVVEAGPSLACVRSLNRTAGILRGGTHAARWVRWTACLVRIDDQWRIVHEHVSVPIDVRDGRALLGLQP
jgi:uncharacterized protein (TIGR02246 family)